MTTQRFAVRARTVERGLGLVKRGDNLWEPGDISALIRFPRSITRTCRNSGAEVLFTRPVYQL